METKRKTIIKFSNLVCLVNVFSIHKGATESPFSLCPKAKKRERVASSEQQSDYIGLENHREKRGSRALFVDKIFEDD